jgi:hypothetical protein
MDAMTTNVVINDEEPSLDSMDRLWAALDASLDPPARAPRTPRTLAERAGNHICLRCGWHWYCNRCRRDHAAHLNGAPYPTGCANVICRSTYWDRPATRARGRRPDDTNWTFVQQRMAEARVDRKRRRHLAKTRELAAELGLDSTDPRAGRLLHRVHHNSAVLQSPLPEHATPLTSMPERAAEVTRLASEARVDAPLPADQRIALAAYNMKTSPWRVRPRTVPPPPGVEELESTKP